MMRCLGAAFLPLLMAGCALPPAISIASLAVDAVSLAVSEKTVTDHAISEITQQDCAIWRGLTGGPLCMDPEMSDIAVASGPDQADADTPVDLAGIDDAEYWAMPGEEDGPGPGDGEIAFRAAAAGPDPVGVPGTDDPARSDGQEPFADRLPRRSDTSEPF